MVLFSEKKYKWEWLWALLLLSVFFAFQYRAILNHPNQFLVLGGDGMKNYYTFMYHVKYDSNLMTFEGMNYPFGENVIFTDNQPLLSNITKIASKVFPDLLCYLPSVHNLSLIVGLIFGALGLFLCFRKLKIDTLFAILCTAGLMLMHPQSVRIHGHFAMFYPVLPWIFLMWLMILDGGRKIHLSIIIALIITVSGLLHMYFFITGAVLVTLALLLVFISGREKWQNSILMFSIQVLIPFFILQFFIIFFNPTSDRPSSPWGFFNYHAYWEGLFFSYKLPLYHFIDQNVLSVRNFDDEGKSYIGLISVVFLIGVLWQLIFRFKSTIHYFNPKSSTGIIACIFVLTAFISFGYPFTIPGLESLLEYTGPFKQFRSIGRVAWVSFYAINLICIPVIYQWLKVKERGIKKVLLYFTIPCIILTEGILYFQQRPLTQTPIDAYYCNDIMKDFPVNGKDFQAILPDPYFHAGSECYNWWDQGHNVNQSFELGFQMHLPTMGVNMSRTSFRQSFLLNELICLPYKIPDIITLIKEKDDRPLLVLETKHEIRDIRAKLTHWTKIAPVIYENDHFKLRKLELSMFDTIVKRFKDSISSRDLNEELKKYPLQFIKTKSENGWGYEAYIKKDSSMTGPYKLKYWMECTDAPRVSAITEIWQFDINHNQIDYVGEANRFNYKRYDNANLLIETPLFIKPETVKIVIKVSKEKQKEHEILKITSPVLTIR
jgi:hypothetical protein